MERGIRFRIFHNTNWRMPGYALSRKDFIPSHYPKLEGENIIELDITRYVINWTAQYALGNPHGAGVIDLVPVPELGMFNTNDVIIIDQRSNVTGKRELIFAGLLDSGRMTRQIGQKVHSTMRLTFSEVGKFLTKHELFYNQYSTKSSNAFHKWLAAGLVLGCREVSRDMGSKDQWQMALEEGYPDKLIKKIIETKLLGKGTEFEGGFYLNDGRRLSEWIDISKILDKANPNTGDPILDQKIKADPVVLAYSVIEGSTLEGNIWGLLSQFVGSPMNEFFTYTDYDINQKPKFFIVLRPLPFYDEYYEFELWDRLPVFEYVTNDLGSSESWGWSDAEERNLYLFHASQGVPGSEDIMGQYMMQADNAENKMRVPIILGPHIARHGLQKGVGQLNAIPLMNADMKTYAHEALEKATFRYFDHNWLNGYFLNGSIAVQLPRVIPKVGYRAINSDTGLESYITAISINGGMGRPSIMNVQMTRGIHRDFYKHMIANRDKLIGSWSGENI